MARRRADLLLISLALVACGNDASGESSPSAHEDEAVEPTMPIVATGASDVGGGFGHS